MHSERKIYLAAILVIAFGLGNSQIRKHMNWFDRASRRVGCVAGSVSDRAIGGETLLENLAERVFSRGQNRIGQGQTALARVQVKIACAQSRMAQRQAEMHRVQAERARVINLNEMRRTVTIERRQAVGNILRETTPSDDDRI